MGLNGSKIMPDSVWLVATGLIRSINYGARSSACRGFMRWIYYAKVALHRFPVIKMDDPDLLSKAISQAFLARYVAAVSLVAFAYDHLLTLDREIQHIWGNRNRGIIPKVVWIMNRYLTEAIIIYMAYGTVLLGSMSNLYVFADSGTVLVFSGFAKALDTFAYVVATKPVNISVSYRYRHCQMQEAHLGACHIRHGFCIDNALLSVIAVLRLFNLWDRQKKIANVLISGFMISLLTSAALTIYKTLQSQDALFFFPPIQTCVLSTTPKNLAPFLAIWLGFDIFLIIVAFYNALDRPHRTHVEVIDVILRDGALLLIAVFAIRLIPLVLSIVGDPVQAIGSANALWVVDSIVSSRMHLRVEGLHNLTFPRHSRGRLELQETD
ncbi:hypothetical protein WG66_003278 [Moniliophthora roreri]|nr:hypothetical protein WG66_003278 [Moniliophthora roreri]